MIVTIRLKGSFRNRQPSSDRYLGEGKWDVPSAATLGHVLAMLCISEKEAGIFFVNGTRAEKGQILKEGDDLEVFSPINGG